MSDLDIKALRHLVSEMDPGPWRLDEVDDDIVSAEGVVVGYIYDDNDGNVMADRTANRDGVLALRNAADSLLSSASRVRVLEGALAEACDVAMRAIEANEIMPSTNSEAIARLRSLLAPSPPVTGETPT